MSMRTLAAEQPAGFTFSADNKALAGRIIAKYPKNRQASAVIPLLDLAQRQEGWVTRPAIEAIAGMLEMPVMRVLEVATFYTMFNLHPVGKHFIQVCTNLPCQLRGANEVVHACQNKLGIGVGETTPDKQFTLVEMECAGACVTAPVAQIGDHYYEDLDAGSIGTIIDALKSGQKPKAGSQKGRTGQEPIGKLTSLTEAPTPPAKQDLAAAKAAFEKAKAEAAAKAQAAKA